MDSSSSSSINLPRSPPPPSHGFPPPHHPLHHLTPPPPPPPPPPLDLAESSTRTLPHKPSHGFPPFHHSPSFISSPPPSSTMPTPKPKSRRNPDLAAAAAPKTATPPCTECGKRFSSWKALFGHMRCHPERQWRGINPPPHLRRPPFLLPIPPPSLAERFTAEEYEVASSLILLSYGPPRDSSAPRRPESDGTDVAMRWSSSSSSSQQRQAVGSIAMSSRDGCGSWKRPREEEIEAMRCDHKCDICSRGFSTGQALGGHKRCHWERGEEGVVGGCSSSGNYVLDLNLPPPPPLENNEGNPSAALDLRLGI